MVSYKKRFLSFFLCLVLCFSLSVSFAVPSSAIATELVATGLFVGASVVAAALVALGFTFVNQSSVDNVWNRIKDSVLLAPFFLNGDLIKCRVDSDNHTYVPQAVVQAVNDAVYEAKNDLISVTGSPVPYAGQTGHFEIDYSLWRGGSNYFLFYQSNNAGKQSYYYFREKSHVTLDISQSGSYYRYSISFSDLGEVWAGGPETLSSGSHTSRDCSRSYNGSFYAFTEASMNNMYHRLYTAFAVPGESVVRQLNVSAHTATSGSITASGQPVAVTDWANDSLSYDDEDYLLLTVPASSSAVLTASQADMQVGDTSSEVVDDGIYRNEEKENEPGFFPPIQPWLNRVKRELDEMGVSPRDIAELALSIFRSVLVTIQKTLDIVVDGFQDFNSRLKSLPSFFSLFDPNNTDGLFYMPESGG